MAETKGDQDGAHEMRPAGPAKTVVDCHKFRNKTGLYMIIEDAAAMTSVFSTTTLAFTIAVERHGSATAISRPRQPLVSSRIPS